MSVGTGLRDDGTSCWIPEQPPPAFSRHSALPDIPLFMLPNPFLADVFLQYQGVEPLKFMLSAIKKILSLQPPEGG
ncbi:hypothetical protein D3C75_222700 [compost metagenome]